VEISHPPYSPDLGPVDFSSFLQWKLPSKERSFRMLKTLEKRDSWTEHCSFGGLADCFQNFLNDATNVLK
jgi:hypothetical protein